MTDVSAVKKAINDNYRRRAVAVYALCLHWGAWALQYFHSNQPAAPGYKGKYWTNRTGQAAARMKSRVKKYDDGAAWGLQHGVDYGKYLEICNDRKYAAVFPIINELYDGFRKDLDALYAG